MTSQRGRSDQGSLFATAAWYYARYRKPYAQEFLDLVCDRFRLDGTGRMLDVGCGTGQLAIPLSDQFEEVVALDVSPDMIAEARQQARAASAENVEWLVMPAEQISATLGRFRLAAFGSSLHWMAVDDVLRRCHSILTPGGGIAQAGMHSIWGGKSEWEQAVVATLQRWLGTERRAGSGTFAIPSRPFEEALADAGFSNIVHRQIPCEFDYDIPYIIGHLYSTSYCNRALLGDKAPEFEADLRETLLKLSPTGRFTWRVEMDYILADKE